MKFREFHLLRESEDEDDPLSWSDYVYETEDFTTDEFDEMVSKYELSKSYPARDCQNFVVLSKNGETKYFVFDDEYYSNIRDVSDWAYNIDENEFHRIFHMYVDDLYNGHIEGTLHDMKTEFPGTVYHYTTEEKWESIQKDGQMNTSYGTGITNRSSSGVFTSIDAESYADGTYGDVCLAIDLTKLKKTQGLSILNLSYEPEVEEYLMRDYIFSILDINEPNEISSGGGMSPYTIIVNHAIPLSCISIFGE